MATKQTGLPASLATGGIDSQTLRSAFAQAVAVSRGHDLLGDDCALLLQDADRIYLGNELCEHRLPTVEESCAALETGKALTLVTPFVTDFGLDLVLQLVRALVAKAVVFEVVVNDFGVLEEIRGAPNVTPVMGHLIGRDVVSWDPQGVLFAAPACLQWLRERYGVTRVELSAGPQRLVPCPERLPVALSLHYPWTALAVTRECPFRFHGVSADMPAAMVDCRLRCGEHAYTLDYAELAGPELVWRGNGLFARYAPRTEWPEELAAIGVDRLVFAPRVPL